jgi:3-dehydroquinate synthase
MSVRVDVAIGSAEPGGDRSYPIFVDAEPDAERRFADELCARLPEGRIGIVTDDTVAKLHLPRYADALRARNRRVTAVVVPDGEGSKSLRRAEELCESFAREGLDRGALVVALGGGVVGDLAGFVASIFLRGVAYVQVPTTLLAQVDSSVGGKTGVNLPAGKNLVGCFWQPRLVWADVGTLATLSDRDRASGLAEVIKHAFIADAELLAFLEANAAAARNGEPETVAELVARSCVIKARVVGSDERETSGARALLNFGHTVGHAIESATGMLHGEAVGLGLVAACRVSAQVIGTRRDLEHELVAALRASGLPGDLDPYLTEDVLTRVQVDKKRLGKKLRFIVVREVGLCEVVELDIAEVRRILRPDLSS